MTKASEQLSVSSFSVARNRLVKMILFGLVGHMGLDSCFKCNKKIENIKEFTIEHKKPWLDVSPDLFWDLQNIAFSHSKCNTAHRKGGHRLRKIGPSGTAWCYLCKKFEPIEKFHKRSGRWNGVVGYCKRSRPHRYKVKV